MLVDFNHDGVVDSTDYAAFASLYTAGENLGRGNLSRSTTDNRIGYAGYRWDRFISKYHVRNRVYEPATGRWLNRDPIGYQAGSISLYEYTLSRPLVLVDPLGLDPYSDERDCRKDCARRHGGYPGYTREAPYRDCIKGCKKVKEAWVRAPDDIPGMPGQKFCSWDNCFQILGDNETGADVAVISCHANAKDGPYFEDKDGVKHRLGDPSTWPEEWVEALQQYSGVVFYCCYIGNTDYPQKIADRIDLPVRAPGRNYSPGGGPVSIPGEVIWPLVDPRHPGILYEPGGRPATPYVPWPSIDPTADPYRLPRHKDGGGGGGGGGW
ncbi:MAG: RHS repeat-associated core domain-containing protein [Phycisphaeraceae bacterium]|nr:RHS repeat-associated core domain-containing protein [Phycisphaeraceae bacterium]